MRVKLPRHSPALSLVSAPMKTPWPLIGSAICPTTPRSATTDVSALVMWQRASFVLREPQGE